MAKTRKDRIAGIESEMERLVTQRKQLLTQEKEAERKARNGRLCRRMGLFESILPDTIQLTEERFKTFLNKTVANDFGKKTLASLVAEQNAQTVADGTNTPKPETAAPAPVSVNPAGGGNTKGNADGAIGDAGATG